VFSCLILKDRVLFLVISKNFDTLPFGLQKLCFFLLQNDVERADGGLGIVDKFLFA